ncbi:hypothetical protein IIA29_08365 [candidate division KSB1 bacterium]|nr:hypothetical protein [candidate division KSB1 bacterium]
MKILVMITSLLFLFLFFSGSSLAQENEDEWGPLITPDQISAIRMVAYDIMPLDNGDVLFGGEKSYLVYSPTESEVLKDAIENPNPHFTFTKQGSNVFAGSASENKIFKIVGSLQIPSFKHPDGKHFEWAATDLIFSGGFIMPIGPDIWIRGTRHNFDNSNGVIPRASKLSPGAPYPF